ncbi:17131_t:CDS:2 [Funneliformis caledonium]|uniref:17131_t:CDS:1 n=1 Tax=Funneliformis caledonium TaxID=1117310 RepID=A0A9N9AAB2_9GLOM|nr:17131_t:CDS:2 [Funneliformis caledonium]
MNLSKVLFLITLITLNVLLVSVSSAPMRLEKRPKGDQVPPSGQSKRTNDIPVNPDS